MKKARRVIITIGVIHAVILSILFTLFCFFIYTMYGRMQWRIYRQTNTTWVSDDGSVVLYVDDDFRVTGTISSNGESIEIYAIEGLESNSNMYIYPKEVLEKEIRSTADRYGYWSCFYLTKNRIVIKEKTTSFFEGGQRIILRRVDNK